MLARSGLRLVSSDLIDQRRRVSDRRHGRNRARAIARQTGRSSKRAHSNAPVRSSKHAHSNVPVRNSKQGRGRRLNPHAAVVRSNGGPARRERGLKGEGIKGKAKSMCALAI
jgi:hypothetical protein